MITAYDTLFAKIFDEVGVDILTQLQNLGARGCLAHHRDRRITLQEAAQNTSKLRVVIGKDDAHQKPILSYTFRARGSRVSETLEVRSPRVS